MIPTLASVVTARYICRVLLRVLAVVFALIGGWLSLRTGLELITGFAMLIPDSLMLGLFVLLGPILSFAAAAALLFFERPIIRWLLPLPRVVCPECNFRVASLTRGQCPECGLRFGPDDPGGTGLPTGPGTPALRAGSSPTAPHRVSPRPPQG